jgi:protein-tyrosine phosphatase
MARKTAALAALLTALCIAQAASAGTISAPAAERVGDKVVVRWSDRDPVDVYVADRPDAPKAGWKLAQAGDRDGRYEMPAASARPYFLLRDRAGGGQAKVAERLIALEQGSNFRDVGGYPAAGGKHVRWGKIYRSGATPMLTDADVRTIQGLGVAQLVDLRSSEERVLAPTRLDGIAYSAVGYSFAKVVDRVSRDDPGAGYRDFPTLLAPQMRLLFAGLLANPGALAYNCSAGQDRTGFATAMVLSALGVPREVILADYHLSTVYRRPQYEMPKIDAAAQANNPAAAFFGRYQSDPPAKPRPLYDAQHKDLLSFAFDEVEARYGSVDNYLRVAAGIGPAEQAKLRAIYLE